ncbi:MAG: TGS domain-containing protein [candidate division KSB1 bacterium]|nr:TGS domain-containing protein [candidate division KSB1 bacterium]
MPANLPPQYFEAERKYREARSTPEKLEALKEMLAVMPKHKGTEKLQADIKRRIAKLKEEAQRGRKGGGKGYSIYVEKEGAGQVTLAGLPNVGKSSLLAALTRAEPEIADYPFTTRKPQPGMLQFENISIQLVDLPPLDRCYMEAWVPGIIRVADVALLVIDLASDDPLSQAEETIEILRSHRIEPVGRAVGTAVTGPSVEKPAVLVGNRLDVPGAQDNLQVLASLYAGTLPVVGVSAVTRAGLDDLGRTIYAMLNIVRVYAKPPGKTPDLEKPFVFRKGSTVLDFAAAVHKDFAEKLKFARVWGVNKFDGQRVNRDYVLEEGDIIELHI